VTKHDFQHALGSYIALQAEEVALDRQRLIELAVEFGAVDFNRPELPEVIGDELRVEQHEAAIDQARAEVDERDLRGVAHFREHAFSEECAAERNPVETADKPALVPGFHRVAIAELMQLTVKLADAVIDPSGAAAWSRRRAAGDDAVKIRVDANHVRLLADRAL